MDVNLKTNQPDMAYWYTLVSKSVINAVSGISKIINQDINIKSVKIRSVDLGNIKSVFGSSEVSLMSTYLNFSGDLGGDAILAHDRNLIFTLLDLAVNNSDNNHERMTDIEQSIIGEIENTAGLYFLNCIADNLNLNLSPLPAIVMLDVADSFYDITLLNMLKETKEVFVAELILSLMNHDMKATYAIVLSPDLISLVSQTAAKTQLSVDDSSVTSPDITTAV